MDEISPVGQARMVRFTKLLADFQEANFYSLHDESHLSVRDAHSISIALSVDGHTKTVTDRLGESKAFRALMDRILERSHAQRWLQGTADTLQAVLADTENLNTADDEGRTVLMWACQSADANAVRELIRSGADMRAKDQDGRTVLMYAAAEQSPEIGDDLDYRAPPSAYFGTNSLTPGEKREVVDLLLTAGADPNEADSTGTTPLMYAVELRIPEVMRVLLAAGAGLNAKNAEGRTPLMYAADRCDVESVRLLVEAGANVMLRDNNGRTVLKRAHRKFSKPFRKICGHSQKEIIHILQSGPAR